ncbi:MAG TPA: hypothetical protein VH333_15900 [Pseudonocardiaceae bacterium]|jgi:hypothetical protein|nr:hypothetical protein [Pseudonocardiaceae bacterium]
MHRWIDPALLILVVTGVVHVIRGAPVDAAIFVGVAAALILTGLIELKGRLGPARGTGELPSHPIVVLAGSIVFGVVVGWPRFSVVSETVLVVVGLVALAAVWRQGTIETTATTATTAIPPVRWGALAWVVLALAWCGWELVSFVHEVNVDDVSIGHPTLSDIVEPLLAHPIVRWLALTAWIAAGYGLVRTGRRAAR